MATRSVAFPIAHVDSTVRSCRNIRRMSSSTARTSLIEQGLNQLLAVPGDKRRLIYGSLEIDLLLPAERRKKRSMPSTMEPVMSNSSRALQLHDRFPDEQAEVRRWCEARIGVCRLQADGYPRRDTARHVKRPAHI